jgi:diadenosine tetraphosphate (Ap4A) HIT family hydrolase
VTPRNDALTGDESVELRGELIWAVDRLSRAFAPDDFSDAFLQNQDAHVHLHVIPRYVGVRRFGGIEFADPEYGDHYGLDRGSVSQSSSPERLGRRWRIDH